MPWTLQAPRLTGIIRVVAVHLGSPSGVVALLRAAGGGQGQGLDEQGSSGGPATLP